MIFSSPAVWALQVAPLPFFSVHFSQILQRESISWEENPPTPFVSIGLAIPEHPGILSLSGKYLPWNFSGPLLTVEDATSKN